MKTKIFATTLLTICLFAFTDITMGSGLCDLKIVGTEYYTGTYTVVYRIYNVTNSAWATGYSSANIVTYGTTENDIVNLDLYDTAPTYRLYAFVTWTDGNDVKTAYGSSATFSCAGYYAGSIPVMVTFP